MALRPITTHDVPTIIKLLLRLKDESPSYANVFPDIDYVSNNLVSMFSGEAFGLIDDLGTGIMFGFATAQWYSAEVNAYEQILYAIPEQRGTGLAVRLIKGFEKLCAERGAANLYVGVTTGITEERTNSLYERLGYERMGGQLRKRLQTFVHRI